MSVLDPQQVQEADLVDWRLLHHALQARYLTGDFATGLELVNAIGAVAEETNHHPDLDLRYGHLNVRLYSHDLKGVTGRDVRMARRITTLAHARGITADPAALSDIEIALDTPDRDAIKPFWAAVLGLGDAWAENEIRDDAADLPRLWFQDSGSSEPRQRFHLDVTVPPEQAEARIRAAVEAGGTGVDDSNAPGFTVLADAQGNRACVCTL